MGVITGWQSIPGFPFPGQQMSGVWIGLFGFAMRTGFLRKPVDKQASSEKCIYTDFSEKRGH